MDPQPFYRREADAEGYSLSCKVSFLLDGRLKGRNQRPKVSDQSHGEQLPKSRAELESRNQRQVARFRSGLGHRLGGVLDLPLSGWGHRQWLSCACPPSHDDGWRADNAAAQFMGIRTHREGPRPQTSLGLNDKVLDFKPEPKK